VSYDFSIFEIEDVINYLRALFRLNHVPIPEPIMYGDASYDKPISYEKHVARLRSKK
jgi:hypothetical protein